MPQFLATPFGTRKALQTGRIGYSIGKLNVHEPGPKFNVVGVSLTSNVATVTVTYREGYLPLRNGSLISIEGTQTASGLFNVSNAAITGSTIDARSGAGTITFALTHANVAQTADAGKAVIAPDVVPETITVKAFQQYAIQADAGIPDQGRTVTWNTAFSTEPDDVTMELQGALTDNDADYFTLDTSTDTSGDLRYVNGVNVNFVRIACSAVTGTAVGYAGIQV